MMWERAWRATGRRTVARTRIPPPYFAPVSEQWRIKRPAVVYAIIMARWHEKYECVVGTIEFWLIEKL